MSCSASVFGIADPQPRLLMFARHKVMDGREGSEASVSEAGWPTLANTANEGSVVFFTAFLNSLEAIPEAPRPIGLANSGGPSSQHF